MNRAAGTRIGIGTASAKPSSGGRWSRMQSSPASPTPWTRVGRRGNERPVIRLLGILCGLLLGWRYAHGGSVLTLGVIAAVILTSGNLLLALREWKTRPGHVKVEAIEQALTSANPIGELDRTLSDFDDMDKAGGPTARIVVRYVGICASLNALTLLVVSAITAFLVMLLSGN